MQRERTLLDFLTSTKVFRDENVPSGTVRQVLHGCRQLVLRNVGLSPDERNLILCCQRSGPQLKETASDKLEEGGDDVKLLMALTTRATHVLQWRIQREGEPRESKRTS